MFTADELKWSSRTAVREVEFLNCSSVEFVCCEHGLIGNSVLEVEPTGQRPPEVAKTDGGISFRHHWSDILFQSCFALYERTVELEYLTRSCLRADSHRHARHDRTVLSVSRCFGDVNSIPDNSRLSPTENLKSEDVHSNRPIHTGTRHRQDRLVVSGGRCELGISDRISTTVVYGSTAIYVCVSKYVTSV